MSNIPLATWNNQSAGWPSGTLGGVVVANGQTLVLNNNTIYDYESLEVQAGGTVLLQGTDGKPVILGVKNNLIINGTITGTVLHDGGTFQNTTPEGDVFSVTIVQRDGGDGGWLQSAGGGRPNATGGRGYGSGGNGGGNFGSRGGVNNGNGSGNNPGIGGVTLGNGQTGFAWNAGGRGGDGGGSGGGWGNGSGGFQSGGGGGGGMKGRHGMSLYIETPNPVTGTGSINLSGQNGFNGGNGGTGTTAEGLYGGGHGGGGGAGGSGGFLRIKAPSVQIGVAISTNGGTGGTPGGRGAAFQVNNNPVDPQSGNAGAAGGYTFIPN